MARVAGCPQCDCELLIPDGTASDAWAKCPACESFFSLQNAPLRELSVVEVVDAETVAAEKKSAPTLADLSSVVTWSSDLQQNENIETGADRELEAETIAYEPPDLETPEAAAQRIDQWFRSAKTLADTPPVGNSPEESSGEFIDEWATSAGPNATIDLSEQEADDAGTTDDFELMAPTELPADLPADVASWDDSQHMDRLLAGIKDHPIDEFTSSSRGRAPADSKKIVEPAGTWAPDASPSIAPRTAKPRRKRSLVRTLLMTVIGGFVGLGAGYYALLWMQGPAIDFLEVAKYLPKAILPPSFNSQSRQLTRATQPSVPEVTPAEQADEAPAPATDTPAEKQATFTEPVAPAETNIASDDRYGTAAANAEAPAAEPAVLDAPTAKPLAEEPRVVEAVQIAGTPTFTADDLNAALQAAKEAQPKLVNGNLSNGKEVQQAKGAGYLALADLAQKVMFVDASQAALDATAGQQADELFRQTLADAHVRGDVAQIVVKWIATAKRRHGGVFFAGSAATPEAKGSVAECAVDLGIGQSLTVLVPAALAQQLGGSSQPVGIVGWIVDRPTENVSGYTGTAPQAIFTNRLIPLE